MSWMPVSYALRIEYEWHNFSVTSITLGRDVMSSFMCLYFIIITWVNMNLLTEQVLSFFEFLYVYSLERIKLSVSEGNMSNICIILVEELKGNDLNFPLHY